MGRAFRCDNGEILGLLDLPREHWEAIEADLSERGLHGGAADIPERMNWRVLAAMVKYSPRTSALYRETFQEKAAWSPAEYLLASSVDILADMRWRDFGAQKAGKRPTPILRPGTKPEASTQTFGSAATAVPQSQFWDLWNAGLTETPDQPIADEDGGA